MNEINELEEQRVRAAWQDEEQRKRAAERKLEVQWLLAAWEGRPAPRPHFRYLSPNLDPLLPPERHRHAGWRKLKAEYRDKLQPIVDGQCSQLAIIGPVGTGKTFTVWGLIQALQIKRRLRIRYVRWFDLVQLSRQASSYGDKGEAPEMFARFRGCDALIIEDFGSSPLRDIEHIGLVIDHRYDRSQLTVITTNLSRDQLVEGVGSPIVGRLFSGVVLEVNGPDRRGVFV